MCLPVSLEIVSRVIMIGGKFPSTVFQIWIKWLPQSFALGTGILTGANVKQAFTNEYKKSKNLRQNIHTIMHCKDNLYIFMYEISIE